MSDNFSLKTSTTTTTTSTSSALKRTDTDAMRESSRDRKSSSKNQVLRKLSGFGQSRFLGKETAPKRVVKDAPEVDYDSKPSNGKCGVFGVKVPTGLSEKVRLSAGF